MVYRVNEPGKEFPFILGLVWVYYSWVWHKKKSFIVMIKDFKNKIKTGGGLLSRVSSTIGAGGLNFCVRNGNR